ncbi:MAG: heme-binding domain-containing protein [Lacibacter sp.]
MLKKVLYGLAAVLVIIQFIRPKPNKAEGPQPNNIETVVALNDEVKGIFAKACYDCHTNNTKYPWYSMIQPVGWWLQNHVNEGKQHFNFDEFATYTPKKQKHKLEEIIETITKGEMPLESYTFIHRDAKLTPSEINAVKQWVQQSMARYPSDNPEQQTDNEKKEENESH